MNYAQSYRIAFLVLIVLGFSLQLSMAEQGHQAVCEPSAIIEAVEFGEMLSSNELDAFSGGQAINITELDVQWNNMNLNAHMAENVLSSDKTGINIITRDAFSSARGIATVIQNSGNQVIINNALILNLRME